MQSSHYGYSHVWLLTGTGEGPDLAKRFLKYGWKVSVSVVSTQGANAYQELPLEALWVGRIKGVNAIINILNEARELHQGFDYVIDATHPFAEVITNNLQIACKKFGQKIIRYERSIENSYNSILIPNLKVLSKLPLAGKNVLLAIGSREINVGAIALREAGANVYARVMPYPESIVKARAASISDQKIAILRPFENLNSLNVEATLCKHWSIDCVVCRQSGGITQSAWQEISLRQNIDLYVISRPSNSSCEVVVGNMKDIFEKVIH